MLNQLCKFSSTSRSALLGLGAAILLSACGGSTDLGNGPEMLNENLPSNVTVSAADANANPIPPFGADAGQEPVLDRRTATDAPAPEEAADSVANMADAATAPEPGPDQASAAAAASATVAQDQAGAARACLDQSSCNGMLPDNVNDKEQAWQQGGGPY